MRDNRFRFQARGLMSGRRRRRESSVGTITAGVVLCALFIALVFFRGSASGAFWDRFSPLVKLRTAVSDGFMLVLSPFHAKAALVSENELLKAELADAEANVADRDTLYQQNLDLKALLGRSDAGVNSILAAVIARPPGVPYDTLIIDLGKSAGIAPDDLVVAGEGAIIGRVADVYDSSARVVLFSSPDESHEGLLRGSVPVDVQGMGGGALAAEIPSGIEAKAGDEVTFPSIAEGISAEVSHVEAQKGGSFTDLSLTLPANVYSLQFVSVWRGKKATIEIPQQATTSATSTKPR